MFLDERKHKQKHVWLYRKIGVNGEQVSGGIHKGQ